MKGCAFIPPFTWLYKIQSAGKVESHWFHFPHNKGDALIVSGTDVFTPIFLTQASLSLFPLSVLPHYPLLLNAWRKTTRWTSA